MVRTAAWLLNLDADDELARPVGYTPARATAARVKALMADLARQLLVPGDVLLSGEGPGERAEGCVGAAWCPTPRAVRTLRRAGARVAGEPSIAVLQKVNHRAFCAGLGQTLPGAGYAFGHAELDRILAYSENPGAWLFTRPFGYAGRGRMRVRVGDPAEMERAQAWIEASVRLGAGLQVEPLVERTGDFALHGYVCRTGQLVLGEVTRQRCDATFAWAGSERAAHDDLRAVEREALIAEVRRAGEALFEEGYRGPFGVDAFRYRDGGGVERFNPRCEINARYSMGWAIGMGDRRPDVDERG
ncbi:MAG: hypothetical protein R3B70_39210 [Polyangiaceae bacterium]